MNPANAQPARTMEGPSGIELHPVPPDPARLSKRAGILFLGVIVVVFGLIVFGIYQRGRQRFGTEAYRLDTHKMTAANDAGKQILSQIPERVINNDGGDSGDDQELKPPLESKATTNRSTMPGASTTSWPAAHNSQATQQSHEPTPEERRRAQLYEREMAALDAPTRIGGNFGEFGQAQPANLLTRAGDNAETMAVLRA